jgi:hypothetical protein
MSRNNVSDGQLGVGCLLIIISIPLSIFLRGFVLRELWLWFMVLHQQ